MADKQITIEVAYDDNGATAKLKELDRTIDGVGQTTAQKTTPAVSQMSGVMKGVLVGAAVTAAYQVGAFVVELVRMSEEIVRVSDTLGMGIREVQVLGFVATQSGNTLAGMTTAIAQMQNRVSSGDDSAIAALQALGVNIQALVLMKPDEQFYVIAKALQQVGNEAKFTELGMDIFGKGFKEVAAAVRSDINSLRDAAPVMSASTVRAFETIGDAWEWAGLKAKVAGAHFLAAGIDMVKGATGIPLWQELKAVFGDLDVMAKKVEDSLTAVGNAAFSAAERGAKPLTLSMKEIAKIQKDLDAEQQKLWAKRLAAEAKAAAAAADEAALALHNWAVALEDADLAVTQFVPDLKLMNGQLVAMGQSTVSLLPFLQFALAGVHDTAAKFTGLLPALKGNLDGVALTFREKFSGAIGKATDVVDQLSRVAEMSGHKTTAALLSTASATAKAFASGGPWAAAIAFASGMLTTFADQLFKTEGRKVNDLRDAFIGAAGGLAVLNERAHAAGMTLDALLRAKTVKDYEAAVAALNTQLEKTAALQGELATLQQQFADRSIINMEAAREIAERYGRTVESLGPKFAEAKLAADWKTIIDDWETLRDWGISIGEAIDIMGPKIQEVVLASRHFGTTVPENMRPLIQAMIDAGLLLDENGNKITDISLIKFGAPLVSEVDKLVKAIEALVDLLTKKLKPALLDLSLPDDLVPAPPGDGNGGGNGGGNAPPEFTWGGVGNFGRGTMALLHGREAIVPLDRPSAVGTALTSGLMRGVEAKLDQLLVMLPQAMARAARDSVLVRG